MPTVPCLGGHRPSVLLHAKAQGILDHKLGAVTKSDGAEAADDL